MSKFETKDSGIGLTGVPNTAVAVGRNDLLTIHDDGYNVRNIILDDSGKILVKSYLTKFEVIIQLSKLLGGGIGLYLLWQILQKL